MSFKAFSEAHKPAAKDKPLVLPKDAAATVHPADAPPKSGGKVTPTSKP